MRTHPATLREPVVSRVRIALTAPHSSGFTTVSSSQSNCDSSAEATVAEKLRPETVLRYH